MYFFSRNYNLDDLKPAELKFFYCDERKVTQNNLHFVQMHSYFPYIFFNLSVSVFHTDQASSLMQFH